MAEVADALATLRYLGAFLVNRRRLPKNRLTGYSTLRGTSK